MRIHAVACGYVLYFAFKIGVNRGELACLLLAMGMVTTAEALNTSVEKLCDFVETRQNNQIGRIKDLAAGGVLFSAVFAALMGCVILFRPELWAVIAAMVKNPSELAVFLLSVAASILLVFVMPQKR